VEDGILARTALSVPYNNLATMYEQMGETTNADKYSQMAKSVASPATSQAVRPASAATTRPTQNASHQSWRTRPRPMVSRK
jgi:hypothetical protein